MNDNMQELAEVACLPITIVLNDEACELVPLSPRDLARATEHLRLLRLKRYFEYTRSVPLDQVTRAKSIAELTAQPITIFDVADDREAAMFLIYLSLKKAGGQLSCKQVEDMLDPVDNNEWLPLLFKISRITIPGINTEDADPLPDTTSLA